MKRNNYILIFILAVLLYSCNQKAEENVATLTGTVYSVDNGVVSPLDNVLVTVKSYYAQVRSDTYGHYSLSFEPDTDEEEVTIQASKVGYNVAEVSLLAAKKKTREVPDITMIKIAGGDTVISPIDTLSSSGDAAHIEVDGKHDAHIFIRGSGLQESAIINFLVTDAKGVPVDQDHAVNVQFSILNGPDGGEYLFPESMETSKGKVYTILNSGLIAGVVQIQALINVNGQTIRALPIRMAIYGGLPDEEHFSLALERVNIAGQVHHGIIDNVTAFVGDKYSNPVAPGTAVYFSTDYCIVEGMAVTDEMGRATVRFMSASPLPPNPPVNPFARIKGYTYTDTLAEKKIEAQSDLLLTGSTAPIQVTPSSFNYSDVNEAQKFDYTVSDIWGYPLIGGSSITVSATDGTLYGDIGIQLRDTQYSGPGTTQFSFSWAPGDSLEATQVYISVTVTSPEDGNGYRSVQISGTKN